MTDGGEAGTAAGDEVIAEVRLHRTKALIVAVTVWSALFVAAMVRGLVVANGRTVLFGLAVALTIAGATLAVRALRRLPHRVVWRSTGGSGSGGELALESLTGTQVLLLEPPVEVRWYESSILQSGSEPDEVTDVIITSAGTSVGVTAATRRSEAVIRLGKAVATGTGGSPPRREPVPAEVHTRHRWDESARWLNDGGDFTSGQLTALGIVALFVLPLTILAGIVAIGSPGDATLATTSAQVRARLEATTTALSDELGVEPSSSAPPSVDVEIASRACGREGGGELLWGPSEQSRLDVGAVATLDEGAASSVAERLDATAEPGTFDDISWTLQPRSNPSGPAPLLLSLTLSDRVLTVRFAINCLTPADQADLRPALEDHAAQILQTLAGEP